MTHDKTSHAYVEITVSQPDCMAVAVVRVDGDFSGEPRYWEHEICVPKGIEGAAVSAMVSEYLSNEKNYAKLIADFEKNAVKK